VLEDVADHEIERIARELRRPVDLGPEVDAGVMAAIRAAPLMVAAPAPVAASARRRRGGVLRWLTRPRTLRLRVSPIGTLAAAGIAIAAIFGLRRAEQARLDDRRDDQQTTQEYPVPVAARPDTVVITQFVFVAPAAKQVALAGDFNDWDTGKNQLVRNEQSGMWTATLKLPPGRYEYAFVVDGERWVADPRAPRAVGDDFDRPSSTVTVQSL
jgi:hypothetical protein